MNGEKGVQRPSVRTRAVRLPATDQDEPDIGVKEVTEHRCNGCDALVPVEGHDCPKLRSNDGAKHQGTVT